MVFGIATPFGAAGQNPPATPDSAASVDLLGAVGRSISDLVDELPGRPVTLDRLRAVARERSLTLESSRVARGLADARVGVLGGAFDLELALSTELAQSRQLPGRTGLYGAELRQALPWGTTLGLGLTGSRAPSLTGPGAAYDADVGLSLSQPLLDGFGTRDSGLQAARRARQAAKDRLARTTESVLADVELGFWDLAEAEATEAVLARSYEIAEALRFRNAQLAARDLAADVDVLTAQGGVALRRSLLVEATRNREDASDALVFLVWGEGAAEELSLEPDPLKTDGPPPEPPSLDATEEVETLALERRSDVSAAVAELEGAQVLADAAGNGRLPSLSLDGSVRSGGTDSTLGQSLGSLDRGWSWGIGLSFSQPLRNRTDQGLFREADLAVELRRLDVIAAENLVRLEVRRAIRAIRAGVERLDAAQEASDLARAQLDAERQRLDLGLADTFRLLETEENTVQAALEAVRARYDLARAITRYHLATGETAFD
jgi:outer membrane protein TolC